MSDTTGTASAERIYTVVGTSPVRPDGVDKVTGRARFGADLHLPNMLVGRVLRSPHAHARLLGVDTTRAAALPGVKAVITSADICDLPSEFVPAGEMLVNYRDMTRNVLAREKVLYEGHAIAAVAAIDAATAERALALIEVRYEVLPHVLDVDEARAASAPILQDDLRTIGVPDSGPTNVAKRVEFALGDLDAGFAQAEVIVERDFVTRPVHQGYIEPHACVASVNEDGSAELWVSTQGPYAVRAFCARLLGTEVARIRVTPAEIGGGFGGKTVVYLEPLALALSRKACRPVKMAMTRNEVFRATGATSGTKMTVKIGATRAGRITGAEAFLRFQAGGFQGSSVGGASMCAFAPYDLENVKVVGLDVLCNRAKVAAYRAPGAPLSEYAVESVIDELAGKLGLDPIEFRLKNTAKEGTRTAYGPKFGPIGFVQTLEAARAHPHYTAPLGPNQGRGIASGYWFNAGGETCVALSMGEDGTVNLVAGTPDIGGLRASLAMMASEELGIPYDRIRPMIGDTASLGYNFLTGGSRSTYSSGMAVVAAAREMVGVLRARAAKTWGVAVETVTWSNGAAHGRVGEEDKTLTAAEIARTSGKSGGPIVGNAAINAQGAGPGFGTHIVDVEVDPETGTSRVIRYTAVQDAGKAIHPAYVEGQMQGGAVQGIGWALNEEYVYDANGKLENPMFLDYRMPVCSDVPMIDTVIVEVPNPRHPYGVRGVGEVPIVPPLAAIANAMQRATGVRFTELPMSPPRVLAALEAKRKGG